MSDRARFWKSRGWRDVLRPDTDLAEAEGLAAGTGLLTGTVARSASRRGTVTTEICPSCGGTSEVVVVDLIVETTTLRCRACARRWTLTA